MRPTVLSFTPTHSPLRSTKKYKKPFCLRCLTGYGADLAPPMVLIEFRSVYLQRKNDRADDSGLPIRSANERARFRRHFPPFFAAKPRLKRRLKRGTLFPFLTCLTLLMPRWV